MLDLSIVGQPCCPRIAIRVVPAAEAPHTRVADGVLPFIHFPGGARHPAGNEAAVSWFNDLGEGWLRIIRPGQALVLLPLQGWEAPAEPLVVPIRGRRGPAKSMDLWLTIAAVLRPLGMDAVELQATTGINRFNVYDWLARSTTAGTLQQLAGWGGRRDRFVMPPTRIALHGEYIRTAWAEWRAGRTTARLRPTIRYFVAANEWPAFAPPDDDGIMPTGVTWLESHGQLTPGGAIPRLAFLCTPKTWDGIVTAAHIAARPQRDRPYDSEALILADDHPLWSIVRQRRADDFDPAWPAGFRALDAMHDPEPRVRDVAEAAWKDWLDQQRIHVENRQGAVS